MFGEQSEDRCRWAPCRLEATQSSTSRALETRVNVKPARSTPASRIPIRVVHGGALEFLIERSTSISGKMVANERLSIDDAPLRRWGYTG